jgi:hypothetical protein
MSRLTAMYLDELLKLRNSDEDVSIIYILSSLVALTCPGTNTRALHHRLPYFAPYPNTVSSGRRQGRWVGRRRTSRLDQSGRTR